MKSAFAPFDERLRLINTVIKPGFAAARAASAGRFSAWSREPLPPPVPRVKAGRGSGQHPFSRWLRRPPAYVRCPVAGPRGGSSSGDRTGRTASA